MAYLCPAVKIKTDWITGGQTTIFRTLGYSESLKKNVQVVN